MVMVKVRILVVIVMRIVVMVVILVFGICELLRGGGHHKSECVIYGDVIVMILILALDI